MEEIYNIKRKYNNFIDMRFLICTLALSIAFVSCKKQIEPRSDENINMTSSVPQGVMGGDGSDSYFPEGTELGFYMHHKDSDGSNVTLYQDNVKGVTEVAGGIFFNPYIPYPSGKKLDIYGYYPYRNTNAVNGVINVSTVLDQSTISGLDEMDFLVSRVLNKESSKGTFAMPFAHKHSKIDISLKCGVGINDLSQLDGASIVIEKIPAHSEYNYLTDVMSPQFNQLVSVKPFGIFVHNANSEALIGVSAILPIRSALDPVYVIKVIDKNGITYGYVNSDVLEGGKSYNYSLTINRSGVVPTITIKPWEAGGGADYPAILWANSKFTFTLAAGIDKIIGEMAEFVTSNGLKSRSAIVNQYNGEFELITPLDYSTVVSAKFIDTKTGQPFVVEFPNLKISPDLQTVSITGSMIK